MLPVLRDASQTGGRHLLDLGAPSLGNLGTYTVRQASEAGRQAGKKEGRWWQLPAQWKPRPSTAREEGNNHPRNFWEGTYLPRQVGIIFDFHLNPQPQSSKFRSDIFLALQNHHDDHQAQPECLTKSTRCTEEAKRKSKCKSYVSH